MSLSLTLAALWVLAATGVAFLPMRYQVYLGLLLLALAVPLLVFLGLEHNVWIVLAVLAAIVSMFRRPLFALLRHWGVLKS